MDDILQRLTALEAAQRRTRRALRFWRVTALVLLLPSLLGGAMVADGRGVADSLPSDLLHRLVSLEQTVSRHDVIVSHFVPGTPAGDTAGDATGADLGSGDVTFVGNLYIVNGLGSTATTNASGNLIVGYNETGNLHGDTRTGSHNIVVGSQQSFSSYGGLVAGAGNTIKGKFAAAIGGNANTASGDYASMAGGFNNSATGSHSAVAAGQDGVASGSHSALTGGKANTASNDWASVTGGFENVASGSASSVSGGAHRSATGSEDWAAGGLTQPN